MGLIEQPVFDLSPEGLRLPEAPKKGIDWFVELGEYLESDEMAAARDHMDARYEAEFWRIVSGLGMRAETPESDQARRQVFARHIQEAPHKIDLDSPSQLPPIPLPPQEWVDVSAAQDTELARQDKSAQVLDQVDLSACNGWLARMPREFPVASADLNPKIPAHKDLLAAAQTIRTSDMLPYSALVAACVQAGVGDRIGLSEDDFVARVMSKLNLTLDDKRGIIKAFHDRAIKGIAGQIADGRPRLAFDLAQVARATGALMDAGGAHEVPTEDTAAKPEDPSKTIYVIDPREEQPIKMLAGGFACSVVPYPEQEEKRHAVKVRLTPIASRQEDDEQGLDVVELSVGRKIVVHGAEREEDPSQSQRPIIKRAETHVFVGLQSILDYLRVDDEADMDTHSVKSIIEQFVQEQTESVAVEARKLEREAIDAPEAALVAWLHTQGAYGTISHETWEAHCLKYPRMKDYFEALPPTAQAIITDRMRHPIEHHIDPAEVTHVRLAIGEAIATAEPVQTVFAPTNRRQYKQGHVPMIVMNPCDETNSPALRTGIYHAQSNGLLLTHDGRLQHLICGLDRDGEPREIVIDHEPLSVEGMDDVSEEQPQTSRVCVGERAVRVLKRHKRACENVAGQNVMDGFQNAVAATAREHVPPPLRGSVIPDAEFKGSYRYGQERGPGVAAQVEAMIEGQMGDPRRYGSVVDFELLPRELHAVVRDAMDYVVRDCRDLNASIVPEDAYNPGMTDHIKRVIRTVAQQIPHSAEQDFELGYRAFMAYVAAQVRRPHTHAAEPGFIESLLQ